MKSKCNNLDSPDIAEYIDGWETEMGGRMGHVEVMVDGDNDGKEECYGKTIDYPSSVHVPVSVRCEILPSDGSEKTIVPDEYYDLDMEGIPLLFWVEYVEETDKQIVCMLSYEGLSTNHLYGYLIEGEKVTTVFEVEYEGTIEMERRIIGGDFDDEPWDWI